MNVQGRETSMGQRPFVIPFFIPHRGCPHQCLFCDQRAITGQVDQRVQGKESAEQVRQTLEQWLSWHHDRRPVQFSFYGGSFTCLPLPVQEHLLLAVAPYLQRGDVQLIRMSTRPDCINEEHCQFLIENGVGVVELGVQSFDDSVLRRVQRGHSSGDCIEAARCLQHAGIELGLQLMPGLPGESRHSFQRGIAQVLALAPSFVRLYPALVLEKSGLADLYKRGDYTPLTLEKAIVLVRWAKERLEKHHIRVVRMGLQYSDSLVDHLLAGPYHPAFGELVIARQWLVAMKSLFSVYPRETIQITLSQRDLSSFYGPHGINKRRFISLGLHERMKIDVDHDLQKGSWSYVIC